MYYNQRRPHSNTSHLPAPSITTDTGVRNILTPTQRRLAATSTSACASSMRDRATQLLSSDQSHHPVQLAPGQRAHATTTNSFMHEARSSHAKKRHGACARHTHQTSPSVSCCTPASFCVKRHRPPQTATSYPAWDRNHPSQAQNWSENAEDAPCMH
jgi:hypothetical protein